MARLAAALSAPVLALAAACGADATAPGSGDSSMPGPVATPTSDTLVDRPISVSPPIVERRPATPTARPVDVPIRVEIGEVDITAEIEPVGVAADGQMELPPDPNVLGWYQYGPAPGATAGSVVLGGHLDSVEHGIGQFARLRETEAGDVVVVTTAAGLQHRYMVTRVHDMPRANQEIAALFRRGGDAQIVLVTCGGTYDRDRGGYQENLIVTAEPA